MLILSVVSVFLFVGVLIGTAMYMYFSRRTVTQQRLEKMMTFTRTEFLDTSLIRKDTPMQQLLARIGSWLPNSKKNQQSLGATLVAAGFLKETAPVFFGVKVILAILLPAFYMVFYAFPKGLVMDPRTLLFEAIFALGGFLLPTFWLKNVVSKRHTIIFHTLPDILDLITVCVEAGISIDSAMAKACENPQFKGNPLTDEFRKVSQETRAGKPRAEAMKDMAARTQVEDVSAFVTMLVQTERFGTSLGQALRVHSDSLRTKRRQIAEEQAAKTAIKMLFPLVMFVFPALLAVILGPAVIMMKELFK